MAKSKETILNQLGVSTESDLTSLLEVLKKYSIITDAEKSLVKMSSVHNLPTVVKNQEQNVKERMYGIVTDEDKGAIALMNKRNVLLEQIVSKLKTEVENSELDEEEVLEIVQEQTDVVEELEVEEVDSMSIATSIINSDSYIPTSKAVKSYVDSNSSSKNFYIGTLSPNGSEYSIWFDISENEPVMMTYGRRQPVEELTFNDTEGEILIFESDSEELTFNDDDDSNLTFNEE